MLMIICNKKLNLCHLLHRVDVARNRVVALAEKVGKLHLLARLLRRGRAQLGGLRRVGTGWRCEKMKEEMRRVGG